MTFYSELFTNLAAILVLCFASAWVEWVMDF